MPEAVAEVAVIARGAGRAVGARLVGAEPAGVQVIDRRRGEGDGRVAVLVEPVMDDGRQVLIAGQVEGEGPSERPDGRVAGGLGPGVRVVVGDEAVVELAVVGGHRREDRLRDRRLQVGTPPVLGPFVDEPELRVAEQDEARQVGGPGVEVGVDDVVGAAGRGGRDLAVRAGLVLAIGEDREADAAVGERAVVADDPLLARLGRRVGVVRGLDPMHGVDEVGGHLVAALRLGLGGVAGGRGAALAPEVAVVDVVVVGDLDRRAVLHQLAPGPAVLIPLPEHVEDGDRRLAPLDAEAAGRLVVLVAGEGEEVRVERRDAGDAVRVRERIMGVARDVGDGQHVGVDRVAADDALAAVLGGRAVGRAEGVGQAIGRVDAVVPVVDPEVGGPGHRVDRRLGDGPPVALPAELEPDRLVVVRAERRHLRRHLQGAGGAACTG